MLTVALTQLDASVTQDGAVKRVDFTDVSYIPISLAETATYIGQKPSLAADMLASLHYSWELPSSASELWGSGLLFPLLPVFRAPAHSVPIPNALPTPLPHPFFPSIRPSSPPPTRRGSGLVFTGLSLHHKSQSHPRSAACLIGNYLPMKDRTSLSHH